MERDKSIDYLRGFAMIGMVMIHTNAYHLSDHISSFLWNYLQFVVQIFVFCSMYLFVKKNDFSKFTWNDLLQYYKKYIPKRFIRLIIPYYLFLPLYFLLQFLINHNLPSIDYIIQSLTLTGGIDINWLVLLFLQLTILSPLLLFLFQKTKYGGGVITAGIFIVVLLSTVPMSRHLLPNYRWMMWIGWSYFFILAYRSTYPTIASQLKKRLGLIAITACTAFIALTGYFEHLYEKKYPPDLFFIAYGVVWILLLYRLFNKIRLPKLVGKFIHFFSIHSYPLFFIHYWILVFVSYYIKLNWYTFFIVVLLSSAAVQWGYNQLALRIQKKK